MWNYDRNTAYKLFIQDVSTSCYKRDNRWELELGNGVPTYQINQLQILVSVVRVTGFNKEIMIVSDGTGKAKVTRGPRVPGNFDWVVPGAVCAIVCTIIETGKLPHLEVIKIASLSCPILQEMWPLEVTELKKLLCKAVYPQLDRQNTDFDSYS